MNVKFWGVRGSISTPEADKLKVGGHTSCVEVNFGKHFLIFDSGTGIRLLGQRIAKDIEAGRNKEIIIVLSHTHWDHIQGLPLFAPFFIPGVKVKIFGPSKANRELERLLSGQMEYDYWPVKLTQLPADIEFFDLGEGFHSISDGISIYAKRHIHPGVAFGYRLEHEGKSLVYSTDTEHFQNQLDKRVIEMSEGADLLIHDAQYTNEEIANKLGWGHSSWNQAIDVAKASKVTRLALFHQDPERADMQADEIEVQAKESFDGAFLAREGLEVRL